MDVRFDLSKLTSQLRKGEITGVFLLARNFTDALLLGLNSLGFLGKGLTGIGLFLKAPTVKRPCDCTSGLVRGDRRKAVFAFKGLFAEGRLARFSLSGARLYRVFSEVRGKSETSEHNPIFANKTAGRGRVKHGSGLPILVFPALPDLAQARLGCLSIEAVISSISLVICI